MLLYQLTQWFEERTTLQQALQREPAESAGELQQRIQEVEQQLYSHAERWKNAIEEASYLQFPYEVPIWMMIWFFKFFLFPTQWEGLPLYFLGFRVELEGTINENRTRFFAI